MEETMEYPPWSPPSISITQPLPQTLLFFISNFHYLIPIKLTDHNYPIWKLQCEGALKATSLFDYIQQSQPPSPTILDSTGKTIDNPMFFTWFVVQTHLRSCLIATLTPDVLTLVRHTSSARDLWVFLKRKFEKSNSFEEFDLQDSSPVFCQICGNEGHGALDCSYRFVEDSQPANATMASGSNADEVFDGSPDRNADGSAVSASITGSEIVTPSQGMAVLFELEMWVLNHSESSLVEDRLSLSPEEMIGCQTRQEIVNFELFQKKPEPQISEAKEKVILMTQPENNISESKPKVRTPSKDGSSDLCSDSLKKNKMVCSPANSKPNTGNNNDTGPSPKETRKAVDNTRTADDQKIQNSPNHKWKKKSHNDPKIQNSHEHKQEGKSHDGQKIQNCHENKKGGKSHDEQKIQNFHENKQGGKSLPVYRRKDDKHIVLMGTSDDQKIQNPQEIQVEGNALQVDKQLNGGKAVVLVGTSDDDLKTQNSPEIQVSLNKKLNSGKATIQVQLGNSLQQVNGQLNGGKWISWSRPPPGMVALHFDGSLRDGSAAGGGVFRDHYGRFMAAFSVHLSRGSSNDSNEVEAKALLSGLRFAHYCGIPVHCIYGDSFVVVQAVTGTTVVTPWKLSSTVLKIRKLLNGAAISHTHREGNRVADELAASGHCLSWGITKPYLLQEDLPAMVRILLSQDCNDCKTYRPP